MGSAAWIFTHHDWHVYKDQHWVWVRHYYWGWWASYLEAGWLYQDIRNGSVLFLVVQRLSLNQGKLEVVEQEMTRVNIDILGISELRWTGMGDFNSDDHYTYYCGQESLRRNGVAIIVNKRVQNAILRCDLKNDRMISVHFQGKAFNIMVIQVYAPTSNTE